MKMSPTQRAILQRVAWLDQQTDLSLEQVDLMIKDLRKLVVMSRDDIAIHLLIMALLLGIRAEHQAAAYLHDAYKMLKNTPPPQRTKV